MPAHYFTSHGLLNDVSCQSTGTLQNVGTFRKIVPFSAWHSFWQRNKRRDTTKMDMFRLVYIYQ